jgi:heme A synthase
MKTIVAIGIALGIAGGLVYARRPPVKPVGPVASQRATAGLVGASASFASNGQTQDLGNSMPLPKWGPGHVSRSPLVRGNLPESREGYQINHRAGEREVPIVR